MKKSELWRRRAILALAVVAVLMSVLLNGPSTATMFRNQQMLELGAIDGIRTPAELGLDYLGEEPIDLLADAELINAIRRAAQDVSVRPEDMSYRVPLGTNRPVAIGRIPTDTGSPPEVMRNPCEAVGFMGPDGRQRAITTADLAVMFETEANNEGMLVMTPEAEEILVSDASGMLVQTRRIPTFDLFVRNMRTNQIFLVPRVNANAFCRDALNAVFNRTLRRV